MAIQRDFTPVYYNAKSPTLLSVFPFANPAVLVIFTRFEFWAYIALHALFAFLQIYDFVEFPVDWQAAGAYQYFCTFFLTFYNAHCFARYELLYQQSTAVLDSAALFVRELTLSLKAPETWAHRLQSTKYVLASTYIFFFAATGHPMTIVEWEEVVKKGLLTKSEARMLMEYPGPEIVPILSIWSMNLVTDALEMDCYWLPEKVQKVAHNYNRLDKLHLAMNSHIRNIAETNALPIPYAYWHLVNLIFALNFCLIAMILATYKNWFTVLPFSMTLMLFMALREVSNQLADPFGDDIVDFPLGKYLDHVFDQCISLVFAFSSKEAYERSRAGIYAYEAQNFTELQLRHKMETEMLGSIGYRQHVDGVYIWERDAPLRVASSLNEAQPLTEILKQSLSRFDPDTGRDEETQEMSIEWQMLQNQNLTRTLKTLKDQNDSNERLERLRNKLFERGEEREHGGQKQNQTHASIDTDDADFPMKRPGKKLTMSALRKRDEEHHWRKSDEESVSSFGSRPRRPHTITGEGTQRSFRPEDVKFTSFEDAREKLKQILEPPKQRHRDSVDLTNMRKHNHAGDTTSDAGSNPSRGPKPTPREQAALDSVPQASPRSTDHFVLKM